jgi:hypothetical protein
MTTFRKWDGKTFPVSVLVGKGERVTWISGVRSRTETETGSLIRTISGRTRARGINVTVRGETVFVASEALIRQLENT